MRTVEYQEYGPPEVLQFAERPRPTPQNHEVLIRTHATTVTSGDWRARSLEMPTGFGIVARLIFGVTAPRQKILGCELAGVVEATGADVTRFAEGDRVFAFTGAAFGCYVEYKCMPEGGNLLRIPGDLGFPEAAALSFGGTTAWDFFRKAKLQRGEKVLINGASGGVGTVAVQIAKHFGAEVTGVCSGRNADLVRSLGADHVIDYTEQDFTKSGAKYDVIMDTVGTSPFSRCRNSLREDGRLLVVMGGLPDMLRGPWVSMTSRQRIVAGAAAERLEDLETFANLAETGECRPVIDQCFPMEQIVEAHRYVDSGRKRGNVVVTWE